MGPRLLLLLTLSIRVAFAAEPPDYVRYAENAGASRLEVAIKTFALPSGQRVDLIGTVHIADAAYYQELNRRFAAYDSVLFELVGDPRALTESAPRDEFRPGGGAIGFIQQAAGDYLHLTFQLGAIDYTRGNMVHADVSAEEFARMQRERGETPSTLFARAMQTQMSGQTGAANGDALDTLGLFRILMAPDSAMAFKKALARNLDQMESLSASLEGSNGSAVLGGRNEVAIRKLGEVLASAQQRHVALFYGAAHMPGLESALLHAMKAKPAGEEWLAAWTMLKPKPR
ncbi:MAG TPA: hypothetical protein VFL16_19145 [Steroidobacteraceae bacterium]|nr:hypothetical protein [Steroidobacteraceae bacterium]